MDPINAKLESMIANGDRNGLHRIMRKCTALTFQNIQNNLQPPPAQPIPEPNAIPNPVAEAEADLVATVILNIKEIFKSMFSVKIFISNFV